MKLYKKITAFVLLSALLFCMACDKSKEVLKYKFEGESDNWSAVSDERYEVYRGTDKNGKGTYSNSGHRSFTLKYKGTDSNGIEFSYELSRPSGGSSRESTTSANGISKTTVEFKNGSIPKKDDIYTLKISWNGKQESFVMTTE